MAGVALGLYAFYVLTAFGLRSLVHRRTTGSTGFRGLGGSVGSAEWWGGALFTLALLSGLLAPVMQIVGILAPIDAVDGALAHGAGLVMAMVGITATLVAQQNMGRSWRIGVDHAETTPLVTGGAFALVRNPVFTAMITTAAGLALMAPTPLAVTALAALVLAIEIQVRAVEEPHLLATHGHTYRNYATRVGRFLPRLGHLTPTPRRSSTASR